MGIDVFSESCRFWEDDNPDRKVVIIDKDVWDRFEKFEEEEKFDGDINDFIERNLECLCY